MIKTTKIIASRAISKTMEILSAIGEDIRDLRKLGATAAAEDLNSIRRQLSEWYKEILRESREKKNPQSKNRSSRRKKRGSRSKKIVRRNKVRRHPVSGKKFRTVITQTVVGPIGLPKRRKSRRSKR